MSEIWSSRVSRILILIVLGICFWRARTQAFSVDEAWVYNLFVDPPLSEMAKKYDACNHVLHTLAMRVAKAELGGGELALRVPSLLAALLYCIAAYRLTGLLLSGWARVLCLALLTLNPLVMDFFVAARGYGLANALFLWALWCAVAWTTRGFESKWLFRAGILGGLSITANLVMLVPAAALGLALLLLAARNGRSAWWTVFDSYGAPALVIAFLILVIPLLQASSEHFYFGASTLPESVDTFVGSFLKVDSRWPARKEAIFLALGRYVVVPAILIGLLAGAAVALNRWLRSEHLEWRLSPFFLLAATLLGSICAVLLAHAVAGVKYPAGRTGLYLLPLTFLACFSGVHLLDRKRVRIAVNLAAALLVFICIRQSNNGYFKDWKYDAGTSRMMRALEADVKARNTKGMISLGTQQFLSQPALWYRNRRRLDWLVPPERKSPAENPFDYYLLVFEDTDLITKLNLDVVARDSVSGEVLARRRH